MVDLLAEDIKERLAVIKTPFQSVLLVAPEDFDIGFAHTHAPRFVPTDSTYDLIIHTDLHRIDALPALLMAIRQSLKSSGAFLGCLVGGDSLKELRQCLMQADTQVSGGVYPRLHPAITRQAMAGLMQKAGFELPVADSTLHPIGYQSLSTLLRDIVEYGDGNALAQHSAPMTKKAFWPLVDKLYQDQFKDYDGTLKCTLEIVHAIGWR